MSLSPSEAYICWQIALRGRVTRADIIHGLWGHLRDGGPSSPANASDQLLYRTRIKLASHGLFLSQTRHGNKEPISCTNRDALHELLISHVKSGAVCMHRPSREIRKQNKEAHGC